MLCQTLQKSLIMVAMLVSSQIFGVTYACCGINPSNQEKLKKVRPLKTRNLAETASTGKPGSLVQIGSSVPFNATRSYDRFGPNIDFPAVLSTDGTVLAIGFNPIRLDEAHPNSRVYAYRLMNPNTTKPKWIQTAYLTKGVSSTNYLYGTVALSGDGKVLVVGAEQRAIVYRFQPAGNKWVQSGSVSSPIQSYNFGTSLALSFNGSVLAVGSKGDDRVDVFRWNGTAYRKQGSPISDISTIFSMSQDGKVIATIDGLDHTIQVFQSNDGTNWVQSGSTISAPGTGSFYESFYQVSIAVSGNGKRVAAYVTDGGKSILRVYEYSTIYDDWVSVGSGADQLLSGGTWVPYVSLTNGGSLVAEIQGPASEKCPGEVRVYQVTNGTWPRIYKYDGPYITSLSGAGVALSGNGKTLAVGYYGFETYHVFNY